MQQPIRMVFSNGVEVSRDDLESMCLPREEAVCYPAGSIHRQARPLAEAEAACNYCVSPARIYCATHQAPLCGSAACMELHLERRDPGCCDVFSLRVPEAGPRMLRALALMVVLVIVLGLALLSRGCA